MATLAKCPQVQGMRECLHCDTCVLEEYAEVIEASGFSVSVSTIPLALWYVKVDDVIVEVHVPALGKEHVLEEQQSAVNAAYQYAVQNDMEPTVHAAQRAFAYQ